MAVVIEEFDMDDMSFSVLGRVENGEVVDDETGYLTELLSKEDLTDDHELLDRFNGPRLIAYPDTRQVGKSWVPYEGPRGGEGWQNAEDPDEVVYQQDPPGEVADGYEEDHWSEYPSDGEWPDPPFETEWKDPSGYGGEVNERDALLFVNYDDELQVGRVDHFETDSNGYKLENGYYVGHSQVVAYAEPDPENTIETSAGRVEVGDWVMYSNEDRRSGIAQVTDIEHNEGHDVISLVGDRGRDEIEVTGTGDTRSEYNGRMMEIYDEVPGIFENVEENGMAMETEEISSQISDSIDLSARSDTDVPQLPQEERKRIRSELERFFPKQDVDKYYGSIESWKTNNTSGSAQDHEEAFKQVLGIESPTHAEELRDRPAEEPSEVHQKIAETMADLSNEFWRENFGDEQTVHRGISNTAFQQLFETWLEQPNEEEYHLEQLALNNYTLNRQLATDFGATTAVVSLDADHEDVALCTDPISNIGTIEDEAEVQIHGDGHTIDSRNIHLFGDQGPSIGEHPEDWYLSEHQTFAKNVASWYMDRTSTVEDDEPPISPDHYRTLYEWTEVLKEEYPEYEEENRVLASVIEEIREDAEFWADIDGGDVEKIGEPPTIDLTGEDDATWMNDGVTPPRREPLSESLMEQLVEQNRRRRHQLQVEDDEDEERSKPMRLKARAEIDKLQNPDEGVRERTLEKAGKNFYEVDDLLIDAWEKQVCAESLEKAPNMWRRDDNVPQFVRSFVKQAATKREAFWDDYNDVPHMAGLRVHEIIKDNLTNPNGWSIQTIANELQDEFEGISKRQAETIARTEVGAVLNKARMMAYDASGVDLQFYWSGPSDEHTTDLCEEVKEEVDQEGGYVDKDTLQRILRRKARKYRDEGGTPERVSSFLPHFNCRHTVVRSEFRFL